MANQAPLPGDAPDLPQAAPTATLKAIRISGTDLTFTLGQPGYYVTKEGSKKSARIVGMAVVKPPAETGAPNFTVQVHVQFDDTHTEIIICEDHLVVKSIEVSVLAVPQKTLLVPN